jgi:hypothetical protein
VRYREFFDKASKLKAEFLNFPELTEEEAKNENNNLVAIDK